MNPSVILISPRRGEEKHPSNPIAVSQRFLNFGVLSLATYLSRAGFQTLIIDEYCLATDQTLADAIDKKLKSSRPLLFGVSCISAYSADRALKILQYLQRSWPSVPRAIGGQHFVGNWGREFPRYMPEADILISGESEAGLLRLIEELHDRKSVERLEVDSLPANVFWQANGQVRMGGLPLLPPPHMDELACPDFSLYPGHTNLFPSVEFSRGCPHVCVFCANNRENRKTYRRVSASRLSVAMERVLQARPERPVQFYMQASNFASTLFEAEELALASADVSRNVEWRTEVRVDELSPDGIPSLISAGLRVLDIGLESASIHTLTIMKKTRSPTEYLNRASLLLQRLSEEGIFTKVNCLIHPGDTVESVNESVDWLCRHSKWISGISSGVAMEYPGTPLSLSLHKYMQAYGTIRIPHALTTWGVYDLHPSSTLRHEEAVKMATQISQMIQTRSSFAESKAFGYMGGIGMDGVLALLPEASHSTPYRAD